MICSANDEQRLLGRLAVFAGGFTISAAESVCGADLDTLQALVDRGLIRVDGERYGMLQTLREYALDKFEQAGEAGEIRRQHARWFLELLQPERGWYTPRDPFLATRLLQEQENFRSALEWAAESDETEILALLAVSVSAWVWLRQGQLGEAERWLGLVREHRAEYPLSLQARVLSAASRLARERGDHEAGADLCEQALAIYRQLEDPEGICSGLSGRNMFAAERGDLTGARAALEEAIQHARAHHLPGFLPTALCNLADVAIAQGNLDEAQALCEEGLTLAQSVEGLGDEPTLLINLTHIANLQSRYGDATTLGRQTLTAAFADEDRRTAAGALMEIAWPLAELGQRERAGLLLGAAIGFHDNAGTGLERTEKVCEQRTRKVLRDQLEAHELQALLDRGRKMTLENAARDALEEAPAATSRT